MGGIGGGAGVGQGILVSSRGQLFARGRLCTNLDGLFPFSCNRMAGRKNWNQPNPVTVMGKFYGLDNPQIPCAARCCNRWSLQDSPPGRLMNMNRRKLQFSIFKMTGL